MLVAQKTENGFDILNRDDTNTSIVRNSSEVRISWTENGVLYQLKKQIPATLAVGTALKTRGDCFIPTGDNTDAIARLVSLEVVRSKQVTIDNKTYTAKLMAVQL